MIERATTFNYRMTVETIEGEEFWAIRELYYDADGNVVLWSSQGVAIEGDTRDDVVAEHARMADALVSRTFDLDTREWRA